MVCVCMLGLRFVHEDTWSAKDANKMGMMECERMEMERFKSQKLTTNVRFNSSWRCVDTH
jgi:hypothetical protein